LDEKRARDQRKLDRLVQFVDYPGCRHAFLLNYFGEAMRAAPCEACDRCRRRAPEKRAAPSEEQWIAIQKILSCVTRMKGRFGALRWRRSCTATAKRSCCGTGGGVSTFRLLSMAVSQIRR
jgi:superfamily II DNA helicase RecQ